MGSPSPAIGALIEEKSKLSLDGCALQAEARVPASIKLRCLYFTYLPRLTVAHRETTSFTAVSNAPNEAICAYTRWRPTWAHVLQSH